MKDSKQLLDHLQSTIHKTLLKTLGFKKNGRTFNRVSADGLIEVINFQSGRYEFGAEIPGLRPNLYGHFTVNIGICVPEYYFHVFDKHKRIYQEYDCQLRTRVGALVDDGKDLWWELKPNYLEDQIKRIIDLLENNALKFLNQLNSRLKIYSNWEPISQLYQLSNTAKLQIAIIKLLNGDSEGKQLYIEYYNTVENENHKEWLLKEAKKLNIQIPNSPHSLD